jgi:hypothetical protein
VHVPVPEQPAPDQPPKLEPDDGDADSVTALPLAKLAEQVPGQLIPPGLDMMLPLPLPLVPTTSCCIGGGSTFIV